MYDPNDLAFPEELAALEREFPADPEELSRFKRSMLKLRIPASNRTGQIHEALEFVQAIRRSPDIVDDYARWMRISYRTLRLFTEAGYFLPAGHLGEALDPGEAFADLSETEFVVLAALRENRCVYSEWRSQPQDRSVPAPIWYAQLARELAVELKALLPA